MDLQDIFVHVLLEVQDFVVKVRNYINTFSESFLNVTVSTKDEEIAFQDDKKQLCNGSTPEYFQFIILCSK